MKAWKNILELARDGAHMLKIYNQLEFFLNCLNKWKNPPSEDQFVQEYLSPQEGLMAPLLDDFKHIRGKPFYEFVQGIDWKKYRNHALKLDPQKEEKRVRSHAQAVEKSLGVNLKGEVVLFGAFTLMDGYARFDKGSHRVFLGVDESFDDDVYLNILMTHELTHVARESQPSVWEGFGLNIQMSHDEFQSRQPVVEHLFSEGFSCVLSQILNRTQSIWRYTFQTQKHLKHVFQHGDYVDKIVHEELQKTEGDYGLLYDESRYTPANVHLVHYIWAWEWVKELLRTVGKNDPKNLLKVSSAAWKKHALSFKLPKVPTGI